MDRRHAARRTIEGEAVTLTLQQCARINARMPCGMTHKLELKCLRARRSVTPSHPVGFIPARYVWELYRAGITSLWSTGGRVHDSQGIVEFR